MAVRSVIVVHNSRARRRLVARAIEIVWRDYRSSHLTQAQVAKSLGLPPADLSTAFHRYTGVTFSAYVRRVRLEAAAQLLANTNERIKAVWVTVGYNDASNFVHQFKQRFGTAPREYRRLSRTSN